MKQLSYCALILLASAPLCHAAPTPTQQQIATRGALHATIAALSLYATVHTARTAWMDEELADAKTEYSTLKGKQDGTIMKALTSQTDPGSWGYQTIRPLAYASLLWATSKSTYNYGVSAYRLLTQAYSMEEAPTIVTVETELS